MPGSPSIFVNAPESDRRLFEKFYPFALHQLRKWFSNKLNPINLTPRSVVFWFLIRPYTAIGVSVLGLRKIDIFIRQQIEPNETVYVMFKIFDLTPPFPLTMLTFFAGFGAVIGDAAERVVRAVRAEAQLEQQMLGEAIDELSEKPVHVEQRVSESLTEEKRQSLLSLLDPFNLTPRMSVYFPVYDNHTSIGFLTIDFRHVEISLKQSLEPSETIISLIRFIDLYSPLPLQIGTMILSVGLFLTGIIYEFSQETREEVISEVKRLIDKKQTR